MMNKSLFHAAGIVVLIVIAGYFVFAGGNAKITGNIVDSGAGNAQVVKMHVENGQYVFTPSSVKKDIPVRIEADIPRMPGCSKSIVIPSFNVRKNLNANDNIIEFTPDKSGTFNVACSMNMYKGTFSVLESDGSKTDYVEVPLANTGSSCGASGGCGCGG